MLATSVLSTFHRLLHRLQLDQEEVGGAVPETLVDIGILGGGPVGPVSGVAWQQDYGFDGHHIGQFGQPDFHGLAE
jgi:hypothetical protein